MKKLVIATRNAGKVEEFRQLLAGMPLILASLTDYPDIPEVEETGAFFAENAVIKAEIVARYTGELTLADDSGLEVDALNGRPGIYSARFAGPCSTDEENNKKLLAELAGVSAGKRTARFKAAIAIAAPGLKTIVVEGVCHGFVALLPQGTGGFGYDPLFFVPEAGKTFAEMSADEKNRISHRAKATSAALAELRQLI